MHSLADPLEQAPTGQAGRLSAQLANMCEQQIVATSENGADNFAQGCAVPPLQAVVHQARPEGTFAAREVLPEFDCDEACFPAGPL